MHPDSGNAVHTVMCGSDTALVVLHEIYGVTQHIRDICSRYGSVGYDVYCPDLLGREFTHEQQAEAYRYYMDNVGFGAAGQVADLLHALSARYARTVAVGFSAGATLAWLAAESGGCDGAVCHYGSRIREYLDAVPKCPVLLIAAEQDEAFPIASCQDKLSASGVALTILPGQHGFCDPYSNCFNRESAAKAHALVMDFIKSIPPRRTNMHGKAKHI